ncbi:MAG TPA: fluoride efflux transporter CrcB [Terriglobales bacterium]|jgi:CrcB protein
MLIVGIAIAGALGALARWGLGTGLLKWMGPRFPYGTLSANLIGCFILGWVMEAAERAPWLSAELRIAITVGFVGALTTFSTWEFETMGMARRGDTLTAAGNFLVNVIFGYALLWAGARLAAQVLR